MKNRLETIAGRVFLATWIGACSIILSGCVRKVTVYPLLPQARRILAHMDLGAPKEVVEEAAWTLLRDLENVLDSGGIKNYPYIKDVTERDKEKLRMESEAELLARYENEYPGLSHEVDSPRKERGEFLFDVDGIYEIWIPPSATGIRASGHFYFIDGLSIGFFRLGGTKSTVLRWSGSEDDIICSKQRWY